jgi:hypothetical protein
MPPKTATAPRRPAAPRTKKGAVEIVVRRGAMRRFDALKTRTTELPVVLTWDRRIDHRRDAAASAGVKGDRRENERRRQPPFTWDLADFVVVEPTKRRKATSKKRASKKS